MTYEDAWEAALTQNMEQRATVKLYKCIEYPNVYWATFVTAAPHSSFVLIGEVRRMTPR